ncbi:outer dense fiber protein 3-like [Argonauta hians]
MSDSNSNAPSRASESNNSAKPKFKRKVTGKKSNSFEIFAKFVGPAPNNYRLPTTVGGEKHDATRPRAPSYSIGRNTYKLTDDSPGPIYGYSSQLSHLGKFTVPNVTITERHKKPYLWEGILDTPSPGTYCGTKVRVLRERTAPAFSFTSRPRTSKDCIPSPCTYSLPGILGSQPINIPNVPAYSMNKRLHYSSYAYDFAQTPGPAKYGMIPSHSSHKKPPLYSLRSRTAIPKYKMDNPGPGAYDIQRTKPFGNSTPKFSMGIKHSPYILQPFVDVMD